jgi:hypothetical protein
VRSGESDRVHDGMGGDVKIGYSDRGITTEEATERFVSVEPSRGVIGAVGTA